MKNVHGWAYPDADTFMCAEMTPEGTYQKRQLEGALKLVRNWRCAVDGGAHVGTWSRTLSKRFERVLAFEPSHDTHEALLANIAAFSCSNVEPHYAALGARPGRVKMMLDKAQEARGNTGARCIAVGNEVDVKPLDSFELPALDFFKLDVEGAEVDALKGATETLKRCKPVVLFEDKRHWLRYGHKPDAPHELLRKLGAIHLTRIGSDEVWGWR